MTTAIRQVVVPSVAQNPVKSHVTDRSQPKSALQINALDGIRGLAVAMVFFSHLGNRGLDLFAGFSLQGIGKPGVFLFFVLSSFLLTRPLLRRSLTDLRQPSLWADYMVRRVMRIFPLFFAVLIISAATTLAFSYLGMSNGLPWTMSMQDVFAHLMMQDAKGVLWSIPVEFKFYFLLPVVVVAVVLIGKRLLPSLLLLLTAVLLVSNLWPAAEAPTNSLQLWPYLPVFIIGSMAALVHEKIMLWSGRDHRGVKAAFELAALAALTLIALTTPQVFRGLTGLGVDKAFFHKEFVFFGMLWAIFIIGTLHGSGYIRRLFSVNWLRYIGLISFSVYIWHLTAITLVERFLGNAPVLLQVGLSAVLTLAIATASFRLIEKPFAHVRVDWSRWRLGSRAIRAQRPALR